MENVTDTPGINHESGSQSIPEIMYFHGTTIDWGLHVDVGYKFTIAGFIEDGDDLLQLAIAICADGDQFSREKGRMIASGRLLNQRKSPKGRTCKSLYSLPADNPFADKNGMFVKDYFKGIEIKVFRSVVSDYLYYTRRELLDEFNLFKRTNSLTEK